jgi:hypothetical protein
MLVGFVVATTVVVAAGVRPPEPESPEVRHVGELLDQKLRVASATPSPRLIVAGGSSALFGIQSDVVGAPLGLHGVNLGTHAGLGLDYTLALTRRVARRGDVVLLALENKLLAHDGLPSDFLVDYASHRDRHYIQSLPMRGQAAFNLAWSMEKKIAALRLATTPEEHIGWLVDAEGDVLANHKSERTRKHVLAVQEKFLSRGPWVTESVYPSAPARAVLADFARWSKAEGVKLYATWPPMPRPMVERADSRDAFAAIEAMYAGLGIPMVGKVEEAAFELDDFFDTWNHLTFEAAQRRSDLLARALWP